MSELVAKLGHRVGNDSGLLCQMVKTLDLNGNGEIEINELPRVAYSGKL